eukprot:COSAG06_NODE_6597_length_2861_cov_1.888849_2_plen_60_part_00
MPSDPSTIVMRMVCALPRAQSCCLPPCSPRGGVELAFDCLVMQVPCWCTTSLMSTRLPG